MTIAAVDKSKTAEREAAMRRRVYPRLVESKRMSQAQADREIAIMDAIAADYAEQEKGERLL